MGNAAGQRTGHTRIRCIGSDALKYAVLDLDLSQTMAVQLVVGQFETLAVSEMNSSGGKERDREVRSR
jgi:hypothetical protein